jgi:beta-lactamase class A
MFNISIQTKFLLVSFFILTHVANAQLSSQTKYLKDKNFQEALENIIRQAALDGTYAVGEDGMEKISLAVIDLTGTKPVLAGVNADNFIYPASVYKMYVAMEVLKQISNGKHSLFEQYVLKSPNDVDKTKEIIFDPRPLLHDGDTVTLQYLLDLMITRSDNSAANCLIDVAGRANINKTMQENGWSGSEVTRKFLKRKFEDVGYDTVRSTETCALHAADFMYKIQTQQLINPWVSMELKAFLALQLDTTKLSAGLPDEAMFYHKTGWWSYYTHDVGVVDDGKIRYIIALFTPITEDVVRPKLKEVSRHIYELIKSRHANKNKVSR